MNKDLFLAILSLDSYNRGYAEGVNGLGGVDSEIGNVTITQQSDTRVGDPGVVAGFYALSYKINDDSIAGLAKDSTVIAYEDYGDSCNNPQSPKELVPWPASPESSSPASRIT